MRALLRCLGLMLAILSAVVTSACVDSGADTAKTPQDLARVWAWLPDPPAAPIKPEDEVTLALRHLNGVGVPRDFARVHELLRRAANGGNGAAAYLLARLYEEGIGTPVDPAGAMDWIETAARLGQPEAQYRLGMAYYRGEGRSLNTVTGVRWLTKAAEAGNAEAQFHLGLAFQLGRGAARDEHRSVYWLERAAEQDLPMAQYLLGDAYSDGRGVAADDSWAARWYGRAAWLGLHLAQYKLALFYFGGNGVPQNRVQAYKWAQLAASDGQENAIGLKQLLQASLTRDQVRYAQALAAAWRPPLPAEVVDGESEPDRSAVEFAQLALSQLGYSAGPIDGHLGPQTLQALAAYRHDRGLAVGDGLSHALLRQLKDDRLARRSGS